MTEKELIEAVVQALLTLEKRGYVVKDRIEEIKNLS